jgi:hypothetical protein
MRIDALEHNSFVNELEICGQSELTLDDDNNDIDLLLRFIETSPSLE